MKFHRENRNKWTSAVIDLTPLIDIVFLLLLFFLLTAAPPPDPTLDVSLPSASSAGTSSAGPQEVTVVLQSGGAIFLENSQMTLTQLQERFLELAKNAPGTRVVLRGDRAARYESFVGVLEAAANANLPLHVAVEEVPGSAQTP